MVCEDPYLLSWRGLERELAWSHPRVGWLDASIFFCTSLSFRRPDSRSAWLFFLFFTDEPDKSSKPDEPSEPDKPDEPSGSARFFFSP